MAAASAVVDLGLVAAVFDSLLAALSAALVVVLATFVAFLALQLQRTTQMAQIPETGWDAHLYRQAVQPRWPAEKTRKGCLCP